MSANRRGLHGSMVCSRSLCLRGVLLDVCRLRTGEPLGPPGRLRQDRAGRAPLDNGNIRFMPRASDGVSTGAFIDARGEYRIEKLQGLPPGKYRVEIYSNGETKANSSPPTAHRSAGGFPPPAIERIPPKYNLQSTLTVELTPSGPTSSTLT